MPNEIRNVLKTLEENPDVLPLDKAKEVLVSAIHDELHFLWGSRLKENFTPALRYLKGQLAYSPVPFANIELVRIMGQEQAWNENNKGVQYPAGTNVEQLYKDYIWSLNHSEEASEREGSTKKHITEMVTYIRTWKDFPAFGFGIPLLDDATGGILPGEICVLTGAPGTMKTSLAINAVDDFVSRTKEGLVYYCTVDMAPREISMRFIEHECQISENKVRSIATEKDDKEFKALRKLVEDKYNQRIVIRGHTPEKRMTIDTLLRECMERQPQLVIIDYLTALKAIGQGDLEFVEYAMPKILSYAHQYETSFLLLSQMSRSSRSDQTGGKVGGHGKGGGIVEELAHTEIELLKQFVDANKDSNPIDTGFGALSAQDNAPQALIIAAVTKARRGQNGQYFSLEYDGPIKRFTGGCCRMQRVSNQRKANFEKVQSSPLGVGFYQQHAD